MGQDPIGYWVLHYYHFMQAKTLPRPLSEYPPLMIQALVGRPSASQDAYMERALDRSAALSRERTLREEARTSWAEYHKSRLTGNSVTDEWERAILEGRDPDW